MSRRLLFHPNAQADVDRIVAYLATYSPPAAADFIKQFLEMADSLQVFPQRGPIESCDPTESLRRVVMPQFRNYLIYYRVAANAITILHVFHSSRDLPTLLRESGDL